MTCTPGHPPLLPPRAALDPETRGMRLTQAGAIVAARSELEQSLQRFVPERAVRRAVDAYLACMKEAGQ